MNETLFYAFLGREKLMELITKRENQFSLGLEDMTLYFLKLKKRISSTDDNCNNEIHHF
jgi:hypothetical protein